MTDNPETGDRNYWISEARDWRRAATIAQSSVDFLRQEIREAPHAYEWCEAQPWAGGPTIPCSCWKSKIQ